MIAQRIKDAILKVCEAHGIRVSHIDLEHPVELANGDYATNVALSLAKQEGKNPRELAESIADGLRDKGVEGVARIEVAGPGFINFFLSREFFSEQTKTILDTSHYGDSKDLSGKTVLVEYTQPNPFKPFHIGHLMSNTIGEALTRILEAAGAVVIRANYQGDVGLHVAKAIWAIQKQGIDPTNIDAVGKAYAYGNEMYETDEVAKEEIVTINKKVYEQSPEVVDVYAKGRAASLARFEEIYALLGTKFDEYFFESESFPVGAALVAEGLESGVFERSEGAVVFLGEKYGLHTRVFITKDGVPTYEAKDLGLAILKTKRCSFDESVTITAVEQNEYFNVVFKALGLLRPELDGKFAHLHHGMMTLSTGKMSSRKGNVITGESLIADMTDRALTKMGERVTENAELVARQVAVGAIKYMVLKQGIGKNIAFDPETSLSFEGDSGPYLQYTAVRARSILTKATDNGVTPSASLATPEPITVERLLYRFPEIVLRAQSERAPQHIAQYLTELAGVFNGWYANEQIIVESDPLSPYRVALVAAVSVIFERGLWMLGIPSPAKM